MAGKIKDGELRCSFCGKTQDKVKKLIQGQNVMSVLEYVQIYLTRSLRQKMSRQ